MDISSDDQWFSEIEMMGIDSIQEIVDELAADDFSFNYSSCSYPSLLNCSSSIEAINDDHQPDHVHQTAFLQRLNISNPEQASSSPSPNYLICFGGNTTTEYLPKVYENPKTPFSYGGAGNLVTGISTVVNHKKEMIEVSNSIGITNTLLMINNRAPDTINSQHHQVAGSYHQLNLMNSTGFKAIQGINNKRDISGTGKPKASLMSGYTSQDHVVAERKRREKLNKHFIALSALVPGLKKMDKATILGDATTYLKKLQERVKTLEEEEQKARNSSASLNQMVLYVKKSRLLLTDNDDDNDDGDKSSCKENKLMVSTTSRHYDEDEPLPEIEARCYDHKNISIRIHCERRKGVLVRILSEIEKLHLTVVHSSVMPFASSSLYITVISQMEVKFSMTVKDLVKNLKSALHQFM